MKCQIPVFLKTGFDLSYELSMSNPVFLKKEKEKYFKMSSAANFTQSSK